MEKLIVPYDPTWPVHFAALQKHLNAALSSSKISIVHVGSTAIPGMLAKPILDIDIILSDRSELGQVAANLQKIGYIGKGEQGIPGRFAFSYQKALSREAGVGISWYPHHLYVCYSDCLALKNHILFRDALLQNDDWRRQYQTLKETLMKQDGISRASYNRLKTDFILSVLKAKGLMTAEIEEIRIANMT